MQVSIAAGLKDNIHQAQSSLEVDSNRAFKQVREEALAQKLLLEAHKESSSAMPTASIVSDASTDARAKARASLAQAVQNDLRSRQTVASG